MERRTYPRITIFSKAGLRDGKTPQDILLLDMSRTGARILVGEGQSLALGQLIAIKLGVLPSFVGRVTRTEGRVFGIALVDKLHPTVVESARQYCRGGELGELARAP
ncbi:PilZ domain-containing protein [Erythrobacter sp. SDW2]|uniref:PilZ domain-containing protein n=1 Tax=Erythrobacter sp. SDW2 TaxID=2907154 RepID=UPI001F395E6C|nr:PilZ domain-containing protein [Erythrobacter sp. SDW2]UIP07945.1 PilZ domain-containing protein [Erythrobacter sp. SDW2]